MSGSKQRGITLIDLFEREIQSGAELCWSAAALDGRDEGLTNNVPEILRQWLLDALLDRKRQVLTRN